MFVVERRHKKASEFSKFLRAKQEDFLADVLMMLNGKRDFRKDSDKLSVAESQRYNR